MEDCPVVERFVVLLLLRRRVGPVNGALGQADEVGDSFRCLLLVELAGNAAHGSIHDYGWAIGMDHSRRSGLGSVRQILRGGGLGRRGLLSGGSEGKSCGQSGKENCLGEFHNVFEVKSCSGGTSRGLIWFPES